MRRTSASGTWAPPDTVDRHEDRSRRGLSWWSITAMSIVGTVFGEPWPLETIKSRRCGSSLS